MKDLKNDAVEMVNPFQVIPVASSNHIPTNLGISPEREDELDTIVATFCADKVSGTKYDHLGITQDYEVLTKTCRTLGETVYVVRNYDHAMREWKHRVMGGINPLEELMRRMKEEMR